MLLLKHQLVKANKNGKPMIFLGWDKKIDNKGWFVKVENNKPEVDWFNAPQISYIKVHTGNPACPGGVQIAWGKYVGKSMSPIYHQEVSPENLQKFADYLFELIEKYKEKPKEKEESEQK